MRQSRIAGQIDKATTHNESLAMLDLAVAAAVDGVLAVTPPANPAEGDCFILGAYPEGAWAGHPLALAGYTGGGWRFVAPTEGLAVVAKASGGAVVFRSGAWETGHVRAAKLSIAGKQILGPQGAAVADPAGGAVIDAESRAAIAEILARLRQHGLIASEA